MASHALDLEEIRHLIGTFFDSRTIKTCIRVCSSWHSSFQPFLFRHVTFRKPTNFQPHQPSLPSQFHQAQENARHVRQITLTELNDSKDFLKFRMYSCLTSLTVKRCFNDIPPAVWTLLGRFVVDHGATLQRLELEYSSFGEHGVFWETLSDLLGLQEDAKEGATEKQEVRLQQEEDDRTAISPRSLGPHPQLKLKTLILPDHPVGQHVLPIFRQIFQGLDSFAVRNVAPIPHLLRSIVPSCPIPNFSPMVLWKLCRIDLQYGQEGFLMEVLEQCPNLEELYVNSVVRQGATSAASSSTAVADGGHVSKVRVMKLGAADDRTLARLIDRAASTMTHLDVNRSMFGPAAYKALMGVADPLLLANGGVEQLSMESLARLETLQYLNFDSCEEVKSAMVQSILSSCPNLESITANRISTLDVAAAAQGDIQSVTWICTRLKVFKMNVEVSVSGERKAGPPSRNISPTHQRLSFYKHLGSLKKLEILWMNRNGDLPEFRAPRQSLYIRLGDDSGVSGGGGGLEELAGLTKLREFAFKDQDQGSQADRRLECEWMMKCWPKLQRVVGRIGRDGGEFGALIQTGIRLFLAGSETNRSVYEYFSVR